jgi:hypothetical protein
MTKKSGDPTPSCFIYKQVMPNRIATIVHGKSFQHCPIFAIKAVMHVDPTPN